MLKKVMIICLALSFVFVGSIAFAADGPKSGHDRGPAPNSGDGIPDGSGWFIDSVSSIIIAANEGAKNGHGRRGPAPNSGDGIPDGPGW